VNLSDDDQSPRFVSPVRGITPILKKVKNESSLPNVNESNSLQPEQKKISNETLKTCTFNNDSGNIISTATPIEQSHHKKQKITKTSKIYSLKVWEKVCYRCFDEGDMLKCDWKTCPKVYHLSCLGIAKIPAGKWYCPWHNCVECRISAVSHCIHCPNAYCKTHDSALQKHPELGTICDEHQDNIMDLINFYRRIGGVGHLLQNPNAEQVRQNMKTIVSGTLPSSSKQECYHELEY